MDFTVPALSSPEFLGWPLISARRREFTHHSLLILSLASNDLFGSAREGKSTVKWSSWATNWFLQDFADNVKPRPRHVALRVSNPPAEIVRPYGALGLLLLLPGISVMACRG